MIKRTILIAAFLIVSLVGIQAETVNTIYLDWFVDRAAAYDVPLDIALAVAIVESNITMTISKRNSNGSYDIGIYQLNSNFIEWFEKALWYNDRDFNAYDAKDNIEMGIIYLKHLYDQTGTWDKAVRAFNIGLHALAYDPSRSNRYFIKVVNIVTYMRIKNEN